MRIRYLQKQDVKQVWHLLEEMSSFKPKVEDLDNIWTRFASQSNKLAIVAVEDNVVVSFGQVLIAHTIRGGSIAHIESLVTDVRYRNKGIAKQIVAKLEDYAIKHKCFKIILNCKAQNEFFYEKHGYKVNGRTMVKFCSPEP